MAKTKKNSKPESEPVTVDFSATQEVKDMTGKKNSKPESEPVTVDFNENDAFDQIKKIAEDDPRKGLHIIRCYAKFRKIPLNKYEVECVIDQEGSVPNLIVRYIYNGTYNFVLSYRVNRGMSKSSVFFDTRDIPRQLAGIVFWATAAVIQFIAAGFDFEILRKLRADGHIVRRAVHRPIQEEETFSQFMKLFD
jgi:hypothetical protein